MGKLILYGIEASPPVRGAIMALKALGLPYEYVMLNTMAGEHKTEEFTKKNPQHTVPILEDDGHAIWDSHAIATYLVSKYGKDDSLYPKDLLKRAVVDQRLHYECGVVFPAMGAITRPLFFQHETTVPQAKLDTLGAIYDMLETFLGSHQYIAGDNLTVADFSISSTITLVDAFLAIDPKKYPKVTAWIKRLEALPYYAEVNKKGIELFHTVVKSKNFTVIP